MSEVIWILFSVAWKTVLNLNQRYFFVFFWNPSSITSWKVSIFGVILVRIFHIRTEYKEILRISQYSVRMRENADQNNPEYGHFLRSAWGSQSSENQKIKYSINWRHNVTVGFYWSSYISFIKFSLWSKFHARFGRFIHMRCD